MNGGTTSMSCPTCGCGLTLVIDYIRRQTYWQCQVCNPEHNDGSITDSVTEGDTP